MFVLLFMIMAILIFIILLITSSSPGKLPSLKDDQGRNIEGSFCEKIWIEVNGMKQGMFIRGENRNNPVLLYLHGGPGTPMLQFISYLEENHRLEKYFTICYWDQRGSGMTYSKDTDASTMTLHQMVEDTLEVTKYLKRRFQIEKIYLLGHSWGSYLGVKTIEKYPEHYLAYIGIGQVTNQTKSEQLSYDYMLHRAKDVKDREVIKKLEKFDPRAEEFPQLDYLVKGRTSILNKYGVGHLHQGITQNDILKSLFLFKGYTLMEKINWLRGADFSMIHLFPVVLKDNLFESSLTFKIPFYIMQGKFDFQVSQVLAQEYLNVIDAPKKAFYLYDKSAHSPNMEEPEKFIEILRNIDTNMQ